MQSVTLHDAAAWDRALLALPNPHILQSWAWGEFKTRHGWTATRYLFQQDGQPLAAASVLQRRLPRLPLSILYVPKGPALDWTDAGLASRVLAELERIARSRRALFVKIDPDVYDPQERPDFTLRPGCGPELALLLGNRGWRFSQDQIQFRNTLLLDLTQSEDELLAGMKQKTRYNVRLSQRRGVTVRSGRPGDLDLFYRMYAQTARRDQFIIRPPGYYLDAWRTFMQQGLAYLLFAEYGGETIAGLMLFIFGETAWYMYGASTGHHRRHMPNYLLQWAAIRRARDLGCRLYDLWGAPDQLDESDPMWGVVRFKLGLGGQLARGLGAWDYPVNRAAYKLYGTWMPRVLAWMRARNPISS
jgi:lipid II:glycine glycyltransferase (peptidoglycan interpeptide bridge formation enzyme)